MKLHHLEQSRGERERRDERQRSSQKNHQCWAEILPRSYADSRRRQRNKNTKYFADSRSGKETRTPRIAKLSRQRSKEERNTVETLKKKRMSEYLCGGRVACDKDRSRNFEVRGGRISDRE